MVLGGGIHRGRVCVCGCSPNATELYKEQLQDDYCDESYRCSHALLVSMGIMGCCGVKLLITDYNRRVVLSRGEVRYSVGLVEPYFATVRIHVEGNRYSAI